MDRWRPGIVLGSGHKWKRSAAGGVVAKFGCLMALLGKRLSFWDFCDFAEPVASRFRILAASSVASTEFDVMQVVFPKPILFDSPKARDIL